MAHSEPEGGPTLPRDSREAGKESSISSSRILAGIWFSGTCEEQVAHSGTFVRIRLPNAHMRTNTQMIAHPAGRTTHHGVLERAAVAA